MIDPKSFTKEWIVSQREKFPKLDKGILEKMIHALGLLEELRLTGFNFIFKGGTSLILLLKEPRRFSTDIDIITNESRESLEKALDLVCKGSIFMKHELEDQRSYKSTGILKAHYRLHFNSQFVKSGFASVLLDVVFDDHSYSDLQETDVKSDWILTKSPISQVTTPSIDSILGDKLTAFAPNTTGIQYEKGKDMEIIKQLFDTGKLYDQISDFSKVKDAFQKTVLKELAYRQLSIGPKDVLMDTIKTCLLLCNTKPKGEDLVKRTELLQGIGRISNHIIDENFRLEDAMTVCGKIALLATSIYLEKDQLPEVIINGDLREHTIKDQRFNNLNKLIKMQVETIAHWEQVIAMVGDEL